MAEGSEQQSTGQTPAPQRRLYRSDSQRILGGVCGGLGEYFGADPVWFRVGFVVLAIGGGSGILLYLILWLIVPTKPADYHAPETPAISLPGSAVVGLILVAMGGIWFVNTIAPAMGRFFWPAVLVAGGLALLIGGLSRDRR